MKNTMQRTLQTAAVLAALGALGFAALDEREAVHGPTLENIKSLAGSWYAVGEDGAVTDEIVSTFHITAAGNAVIETIFPGRAEEMISVYHQDGKQLVMTHYCMMGNQPYMVADADGTANVIRFECQKAGNTKSHADTHMHVGVFTIGDGTLKTEWTLYADLAPINTVAFELVRNDM